MQSEPTSVHELSALHATPSVASPLASSDASIDMDGASELLSATDASTVIASVVLASLLASAPASVNPAEHAKKPAWEGEHEK